MMPCEYLLDIKVNLANETSRTLASRWGLSVTMVSLSEAWRHCQMALRPNNLARLPPSKRSASEGGRKVHRLKYW